MWRLGIADVGSDAAKSRRARHAPPHHCQLPLAFDHPNDRSDLIRKDRVQEWEIAGDVPPNLE